MLNLTPHHRFHVPNGLAMLAAVLLLISSVYGYNTSSPVNPSAMNVSPAVNAECSDNDGIGNRVVNKRRGLNLVSLLFRRG